MYNVCMYLCVSIKAKVDLLIIGMLSLASVLLLAYSKLVYKINSSSCV